MISLLLDIGEDCNSLLGKIDIFLDVRNISFVDNNFWRRYSDNEGGGRLLNAAASMDTGNGGLR